MIVTVLRSTILSVLYEFDTFIWIQNIAIIKSNDFHKIHQVHIYYNNMGSQLSRYSLESDINELDSLLSFFDLKGFDFISILLSYTISREENRFKIYTLKIL